MLSLFDEINLSQSSTQSPIPNRCYNWSLHKYTINPIHGKIMLTRITSKQNSHKCFNWNMYVDRHWQDAHEHVCVTLWIDRTSSFLLQVYFLEELLSAFVTPIVLCFQLRRKSLQIIDFLRNFTVQVQGVGDVCSFAQLDVAKHGDMKVNAHFDRCADQERDAHLFPSGLLRCVRNQHRSSMVVWPTMANLNSP